MRLRSYKSGTGRSLQAGYDATSASGERRYFGEVFTPMGESLFAALDLANRRSIAIPKSALLLLTACSNWEITIAQNRFASSAVAQKPPPGAKSVDNRFGLAFYFGLQ